LEVIEIAGFGIRQQYHCCRKLTIIQLVSGDVLHVIPGSLYPALHKLEARGLIVAEWGASENNRRAKFYKLTAAGKKRLDEEWETWKRFSGAFELILRDA